jgi:hypothetical protein
MPAAAAIMTETRALRTSGLPFCASHSHPADGKYHPQTINGRAGNKSWTYLESGARAAYVHYTRTTVCGGGGIMFRSHLRKSHRFLLTTTLVAVVALVLAAAAYAIGSSVSPESQTGTGGIQVSWTGNWSGVSPFDVYFYYGDGAANKHLANTNATSSRFVYTFYPCNETTYTQTLQVTDHLGLNSASQSQAQIQPGNIC